MASTPATPVPITPAGQPRHTARPLFAGLLARLKQPAAGGQNQPPRAQQANPREQSGQNAGRGPVSSLSPAEFSRFRALAHTHFGLDLKDGKQALVAARLRPLLGRHGCSSYAEYCDFVEAEGGEALVELADALSTNFTSFLREPAHFEFLAKEVAPRLGGRHSIDLWSAASSTGEEPYSVLFTLLDVLGPNAPVRVLATDISTKALAAVASATYSAEAVLALPREWARRYFLRGNGRWDGWYRVKPEFRKQVVPRRFNLLDSPLPDTRFAAILCRNVMIYFDKPTQRQVAVRLAGTLEEMGTFFIGHSENLHGLQHGLEYVQPAVYRKAGERSS